MVDIVGIDIYGLKRDYLPWEEKFKRAERNAEEYKMVELTKNGVISDPDLLKEKRAKWFWYCT